MRSCRVVRASASQCHSRICPGFHPCILRHGGIWGAADETVMNFVHKKKKSKKSPFKNVLWIGIILMQNRAPAQIFRPKFYTWWKIWFFKFLFKAVLVYIFWSFSSWVIGVINHNFQCFGQFSNTLDSISIFWRVFWNFLERRIHWHGYGSGSKSTKTFFLPIFVDQKTWIRPRIHIYQHNWIRIWIQGIRLRNTCSHQIV